MWEEEYVRDVCNWLGLKQENIAVAMQPRNGDSLEKRLVSYG